MAYRRSKNKATVIFADRLKDLGYDYAARRHLDRDQGHEDPGCQAKVHRRANPESPNLRSTTRAHHRRRRYNKVVDIWAEDRPDCRRHDARLHWRVADVDIEASSPIFMMADSGARGSAQQIRSSPGCAVSWRSPPVRSSRRR
jgi:DNA-directed RNA polymerase subunit beta'